MNRTIITSILLSVALCVASCGKPDGKSTTATGKSAPASGGDARSMICKTWRYKGMTINGSPLGIKADTLSEADQKTFAQGYEQFKEKSTMTFNTDGTFEAHVYLNGGDIDSKGKWEMSADGKQITSKYDAGNAAVFTVAESSADRLVLNSNVDGAATSLELGQ